MGDVKRSDEDLRFFKVEIKLQSGGVLKTTIDCASVSSISMDATDSVLVFLTGETLRLPCVDTLITYTDEEAIRTFEALSKRWVAYKMSVK